LELDTCLLGLAVQLRIREEDEPIVGTSRKIQKKTAQKDAAQKVLAKLEVSIATCTPGVAFFLECTSAGVV
jgi:hypothetical protein